MNKTNKPVIFCHFGNSPYLEYTLRQVKLTNPDNWVILLGDVENREIAESIGVDHENFSELDHGEEIKEFDRVYKHIAGKNHGKKFWTKFVFKRWFYVHRFLVRNKIEAFWHFDSDNMILSDLNQQEHKLTNYDCTEQCEGKCMNGYISSFKVVDGYVKKINQLFQNQEYLNLQLDDFRKNPNFAFTEMRAFQTYRDQENIKTVRLNAIIDGESFDDCICFNDGYETYNYLIAGQKLKKLFVDTNYEIYCRHIETSEFIKMNSLNLSWVPVDLFKFIYSNSLQKKNQVKNYKSEIDKPKELDLSFLNETESTYLFWLKGIVPRITRNQIKSFLKNLRF